MRHEDSTFMKASYEKRISMTYEVIYGFAKNRAANGG
jgi:hypothetical protein